ncbi:MAG: PA2778 family cysteine peptidase [Desulfobacterales bacterium]|nr:PA2778 family cysteine peptidase [Desulfobacterales bacterium]
MQFYCIVLLSCAGILLSSCTGLNKSVMLEKAGNVPPRVEIEAIPFYSQKAYQCGPAALAMVLNWSGLPISPEDLTAEVFTPQRKGSLQSEMVSAVRRNGRIAYVFTELSDLFVEVAAGHPVIILQNLGLSWYPVWHYAVVVGYDLSEKYVILRSGNIRRKLMSFQIFEKTWARGNYWGLLILQSNQLPATVKEDLFLNALLGLEEARQFRFAIDGYHTALTQWPKNLTAHIGIGNCYYALGELENAEEALRKAIRYHPKSGPVFNNLAQIFFEQGRKQDALAAAKKAVSLGGPMSSVYQKTLEEIEGLNGK